MAIKGMGPLKIVIFTPIRLLADVLSIGLNGRNGISTVETVDTSPALRKILTTTEISLVLIDATQGVDLDEVQKLAVDYPDIVWLAFGLEEQRNTIINQEGTGFSGFIPRDVTIDELYEAMSDAVSGVIKVQPENSETGSSNVLTSINNLLHPFRGRTSRRKK